MKISIIGTGKVGASVGLVLTARQLADELVLVGRSIERARAEALDLQHATAFGRPTRIVAGDVAATADSDILILCLNAVVPQPGDRQAGATGNAKALRELIPALSQGSPNAILIVATNPVDVMTTLAGELGTWPAGRVIGTGTLLDTMRLRSRLSQEIALHAQDIRAYVLGEHGEHQFVAFSLANVVGGPLPLTEERMIRLEADVREVGHEIMRTKGYTNAGIALAIAEIVETIVRNLQQVLPVSVRLDGYCGVSGLCLSLPAVLGAGGVLRTLPMALSPSETEAFAAAARSVETGLKACR